MSDYPDLHLLIGGNHNDSLNGGTGNDELRGNSGSDVFAAVALHVHLSHGKPCDQAAELAYQTADMMLKKRGA